MLRNYFTLYHATRELHERLTGGYLFEIHSQQKNEIILAFVTPEGGHLQLIVTVRSPYFSLYTREGLNRKSRNTAGIMSRVFERQLTEVAMSPIDRQIVFTLDDGHSIVLRMFSAETNVLLVHDKRIVEAFKDCRNLENTPFRESDDGLPVFGTLEALASSPSLFQSKLESTSHEDPLDRRLLTILPGFDRKLVRQLVADAGDTSPASLHEAFVTIFYDLASPTPCVIEQAGGTPLFSLFEPAADDDAVLFESVLEALNHYSRKMYRHLHLHDRAGVLRRELVSRIGKLEKELAAGVEHDPAEVSQRHETFGHLLTGVIGLLEASSGQVTVPNLFEAGTPDIVIPLRPGLSIQENAAWYFNRASKNRKKASAMHIRHAELRAELDALRQKLEELDSSGSPERLQSLIDAGSPPGGRPHGKKRGQEEKKSPFRVIPIGTKITLYIGRNSAGNEKLTFGFARPDDIWLHARGASGSHCVLKGAGMHNTSEIRRAAEIAAWHSSAKHSELVPVICTQKKYVKKDRKKAGSVIIERETVVMARPLKE